MEINELNDEDMLELLMTSEYESTFSPSEFKFMLLKFRYFYRVLHSNNLRIQYMLESDIKMKQEEIDRLISEKTQSQINYANLKNIVDLSKNRKLSFIERLTGKIKYNIDENRTI